MNLVFIDFETYWSKTHSLSKMLPMSYVMHPETEIISAAIKVNDGPVAVYFGEDAIRAALDCIDWTKAFAIAHNMSGFDAMILAWRFGVRPAMYGCTLAMARPLHAKTTGLGLGKLVAHYGLGVKDAAVLTQTQGRKLADFAPAERDEMARYNSADTEQCAALFKRLVPHFNAKELFLIDATTRMLVDTKLELDVGLLKTALTVERSNKHKALLEVARLMVGKGAGPVEWSDEAAVAEKVREVMASADKFASLLEARGVAVPMKPSPTNPEKQVPALAKTDEQFIELQDHDDPVVATAARVRLEVKSTITESRIESLLEVAAACEKRLPVPLHYAGADTTGRWSGWAYNPQNFPRVGKTPKVSDALRRCVRAPKGHKIVVADQSGIELRVNHFLWGVPSTMALYASDPKADLYRAFAAERYGITPDEVDSTQRQMGKVAHLGLGFGAGWKTFQRFAKTVYGLVIPDDEAESIVRSWRSTYSEIADGWKYGNHALRWISQGQEVIIDQDGAGLCTTCAEGIRLPSGRLIRYPNLVKDETATWPDGAPKTEWKYGAGRHVASISGPKVVENMVQALARDSIADNAVAMFKQTGLRPVHTVHDELIYVVPQSIAQDTLETLQGIMRKPPAWWPQLVTWSEGGIADSYAEAK